MVARWVAGIVAQPQIFNANPNNTYVKNGELESSSIIPFLIASTNHLPHPSVIQAQGPSTFERVGLGMDCSHLVLGGVVLFIINLDYVVLNIF
jgi:hypothetical protein